MSLSVVSMLPAPRKIYKDKFSKDNCVNGHAELLENARNELPFWLFKSRYNITGRS